MAEQLWCLTLTNDTGFNSYNALWKGFNFKIKGGLRIGWDRPAGHRRWVLSPIKLSIQKVIFNQIYVHMFKELKYLITLTNLLLVYRFDLFSVYGFSIIPFIAMILFIFLVRNDYEKSILSNFSFLVMVSNLFPLISQICQT
jgi:hypothetical protein